MKSLITKVIQFRWFVIVAVIALTAFLGLQIKNLKIVINPNTMLPQHHQNVIGTNVAEELFGSKHVVVIGVSAADGGNALTQNVLEVVQHLSEKMPAIEGVKGYTLMSVTADKAKSIAANGDELVIEPLLETPINAQNIKNLIQHLDTNPLYQGTLVSQDHKVVSVTFAISAGQGGFRQIMDQVQAVTDQNARPGVVITASGTPVFFAQVERFAQRMGFLFPIALILIGLIHFEAFRSIQGLVLPLVTAVLAVVWGLGIMGTANVPMDAFNATTPILILAVAAGHAVQILKRYYEEYDRLGNLHPELSPIDINRQAVVESLSKVAPVMIAAGGVAIIGFFSLITFDVATIRTFGIFTGLGILSALLIELTFIPALRSVLRPPKRVAPTSPAKPRLWDRVADHLSALVLKRYKAVVVGFILVALIGGLGAAFINRENSTKSYFADNVQVRHDDAYLNSHLAGTNTLYVVFKGKDKDAIKQPANLRLIEETQRYLESLPNVGKTVSIVDLIKQMNRSLNTGQAEFNTIPETEDLVSQFLFLYSMSGDPVDFESYVDYDYQNANLIVWMKDDSSKYAETIVRNIRDFVTPRLANTKMEILIGGSVPQSSALSETLVDGKQRNILQMIIVVFAVGILLFRSFIAGICLILPLVVTVLMNFGVMGITGIPLNTPNAVSSAMAIGIGADYAIYMLYRMREELKKHNHFDRALEETMRTAGKAVVYVATAIAGGYSVLMLSKGFYVHIWFGVLIVMSMVVSAISALVLVPALLKWLPSSFLKSTNTYDMKSIPGTALAVVIASGLLAMTPSKSYAGALTAEQIMVKNYESTRVTDSLSRATFTLISPKGQERVRKTFGATLLDDGGKTNRRVIRFLSPSDVRNTSTLLVEHQDKDDEIWVYLPAMKKTRRISADNKKSSFVGTDLSYGDIVGHKPQDWTHTITQTTDTQLVIESIAKNEQVSKDSGYSRRVNWINKTNFVAVRTDFYDRSGKLLKTVENSDIHLVDDSNQKWQAMKVEAKNHQTGHSTRVQLDEYKANTQAVDMDYFSMRYLEKEE